MSSWLERREPADDRIDLPEGARSIVFGRSPKCNVVLDDATLSAKHFEISHEDGLWILRDLGSERGVEINGAPVKYPRALFTGDVIRVGKVVLAFQTDVPEDNTDLIHHIADDPSDPERWRVYSDWLLERSDPLGERLAHAFAGERLDHSRWVGPLWDEYVNGSLEIDWQHGFVRRAVVRSVVGKLQRPWSEIVARLLQLRVAPFIEELVIDDRLFRTSTNATTGEVLEEVQKTLCSIQPIPATLRSVRLGYAIVGSASTHMKVSPALSALAPKLADTSCFVRASHAVLRQVELTSGVRLSGFRQGIRVLQDVTRIRREERTLLHFETPPGIPFTGEGNPCHFFRSENGHHWNLAAGRLRGSLRVNQRIDSVYPLLPGDVLTIQGAGVFRFEIE